MAALMEGVIGFEITVTRRKSEQNLRPVFSTFSRLVCQYTMQLERSLIDMICAGISSVISRCSSTNISRLNRSGYMS